MKLLRNGWIDTLRGLAALAVVFYHFNIFIKSSSIGFNRVAGYGQYGVQVFFLISGFCIQASAHRCQSAREFFRHRFWRIYPPYLLSLAVLIAVVVARKFIVGAYDVSSLPRSVGGWLATLTLTTDPVTRIPTMNWVYWSLSYEIFYYAIIGLGLVFRFNLLFFYVLTELSLVPHLTALPGMFFLGWWPVFGLGAALYEYVNGQKKHGLALMIFNLLAVIYLSGAFKYFSNAAEVPDGCWPVVGSVLFAWVTILFSLRGGSSGLNRDNPLAKVGLVSYSLYLLHVPVGIFLLKSFEKRLAGSSATVCALFYLGQLVLCLAAAWAAFRWVEKPAMAMGKRQRA